MFGSYGNYDIDIQIMRFGAEKRVEHLSARLGMILRIIINSSRLPEIVLPFLVAPTAGLGRNSGSYGIDLAVYANPLTSYNKGGIYPAVDMTMVYRF